MDLFFKGMCNGETQNSKNMINSFAWDSKKYKCVIL